MKRGQRPSAEQVVLMLRQIEVQTAQGKSIAVACKEADVSEQSYRDECLRQEIFYSLREAQAVIGLWQDTYNRVRPHSSLGYRPPAPVSFPDLAFRLPMATTMQSPHNWPGPKYRSGQSCAAADQGEPNRRLLHPRSYQTSAKNGGGEDSNLRRHCQRSYGPPPLPLGHRPHAEDDSLCADSH